MGTPTTPLYILIVVGYKLGQDLLVPKIAAAKPTRNVYRAS
jgi:hypothetical protein